MVIKNRADFERDSFRRSKGIQARGRKIHFFLCLKDQIPSLIGDRLCGNIHLLILVVDENKDRMISLREFCRP